MWENIHIVALDFLDLLMGFLLPLIFSATQLLFNRWSWSCMARPTTHLSPYNPAGACTKVAMSACLVPSLHQHPFSTANHVSTSAFSATPACLPADSSLIWDSSIQCPGHLQSCHLPVVFSTWPLSGGSPGSTVGTGYTQSQSWIHHREARKHFPAPNWTSGTECTKLIHQPDQSTCACGRGPHMEINFGVGGVIPGAK